MILNTIQYGADMDHYANAFYVEPGQCFRFVMVPEPGRAARP